MISISTDFLDFYAFSRLTFVFEWKENESDWSFCAKKQKKFQEKIKNAELVLVNFLGG
jgi:hypothetical protein